MATHAAWTSKEETIFLDFLVEHKAEAGDGGNFKTTTYQKALAHIAPFFERGGAKKVKTLRNKWTVLRKTYRVVQAIKTVSGWVWDDETGASITADTAASWEDYVKKHPEAKPFRNKGWKHFFKMALILPSTVTGSNVFHPTSAAIEDGSNRSSSPELASTPPASSDPQDEISDHNIDSPPSLAATGSQKRAREAATPSLPAAKRVRASQGAAALHSMSESLANFGTAITAALAPPLPPAFDPSPVRRTTAVAAVLRLEADWLSTEERVALIDLFRIDRTASDIYLALDEPNVRKEWVRIQLKKLGITV